MSTIPNGNGDRFDRTVVPAEREATPETCAHDAQGGAEAEPVEIAGDLILGDGHMSPLLDLERTQWLGSESLGKLQGSLLRRLLVEVYDNVSYWREALNQAGIDPGGVRSIEDCRALPILAKQSFRLQGGHPVHRGRKDMLHKNFGELPGVGGSTSGSEGALFHYFLSLEAARYYADGCRNRCIGWAGFDFNRDRVAVNGGRVTDEQGVVIAGNKMGIPILNMEDAGVFDKAYEALTWFGPRYMRILPSALYQFCQLLRRHGRTFPLDSIVTTGEMLYDHQREFIEETLGCRIFNEYGAWDGGAGAAECEEHDGLHWHMERSILEIVDDEDNPVAPGQMGRIVVTDLHNYIMPFIRYAVGDWAVASGRRCPCGRELELVDQVVGRSSDFIVLPSGKRVPGQGAVLLLYKQCRKFQCVQSANGPLEIRVVPLPDRRFKDTRETIIEWFAGVFPGLPVSVIEVAEIALPPSGKHRLVMSEAQVSRPASG
ncbi:MAG: phenylacetate--CoA ligase family protein [Planctomycetota bacterium]|jgi:phenylacetate-CoA ligase